jgi:hypothetical protein
VKPARQSASFEEVQQADGASAAQHLALELGLLRRFRLDADPRLAAHLVHPLCWTYSRAIAPSTSATRLTPSWAAARPTWFQFSQAAARAMLAAAGIAVTKISNADDGAGLRRGEREDARRPREVGDEERDDVRMGDELGDGMQA